MTTLLFVLSAITGVLLAVSILFQGMTIRRLEERVSNLEHRRG